MTVFVVVTTGSADVYSRCVICRLFIAKQYAYYKLKTDISDSCITGYEISLIAFNLIGT